MDISLVITSMHVCLLPLLVFASILEREWEAVQERGEHWLLARVMLACVLVLNVCWPADVHCPRWCVLEPPYRVDRD